jgi:predicted RNA-binding Zn-ribbon protein involved in translation (DUF1610 family)
MSDEEKTKTVLKFGDPESIKIKKDFELKIEKDKATTVIAHEQEIEQEPIYEYDWTCPHCGRIEILHEEDMPSDKLIKCYQCKKWLKIKIL